MGLFIAKAIMKSTIAVLLFDISAVGFILMSIPDIVCGIIFALSLLTLASVAYDYDKYEQKKHRKKNKRSDV